MAVLGCREVGGRGGDVVGFGLVVRGLVLGQDNRECRRCGPTGPACGGQE